MKEARGILVIVLFGAGAARADLCSDAIADSGEQSALSWASLFADRGCLREAVCLGDVLFPSGSPSAAITADPRQPRAFQLPVPPGSDALCFSGIISIGILQTVRRMRHAQWALPEWYFYSGRGQVNHAYALELPQAPLCLSVADSAVYVRPEPSGRARSMRIPPRPDDRILFVVGPRAPPRTVAGAA